MAQTKHRALGEIIVHKHSQECGKNGYTKEEARRVKMYIGRGRGKDLRIYYCDWIGGCFKYHLTSRKGGMKIANDGI